MSGRTYGPVLQCSELAAKQHGVISTSQAKAAGLSRDAIKRLVQAGSWRRVRPSVLRLWRASNDGQLWLQRLSAAALWLGDDAAVSHRAAATLRGLDGVAGSPLEFSTQGRRRTLEPGLIIHRLELDRADIEVIQGFRVTTVGRTLVDLCAVTGPENVELALESALRARMVTLEQVHDALERSPTTQRGRATHRSLLERHPGRSADSALEVRVWRLLRNSRLPLPVRQYEVRDQGRLVARVDFAYPDVKLAIEADGYRFHASAPDWRRDRERQNALMRLGWVVYRITWDDTLRGGRRVVADLAQLLARQLPPEA